MRRRYGKASLERGAGSGVVLPGSSLVGLVVGFKWWAEGPLRGGGGAGGWCRSWVVLACYAVRGASWSGTNVGRRT